MNVGCLIGPPWELVWFITVTHNCLVLATIFFFFLDVLFFKWAPPISAHFPIYLCVSLVCNSTFHVPAHSPLFAVTLTNRRAERTLSSLVSFRLPHLWPELDTSPASHSIDQYARNMDTIFKTKTKWSLLRSLLRGPFPSLSRPPRFSAVAQVRSASVLHFGPICPTPAHILCVQLLYFRRLSF